jgi:hypothetical protein
MPLKYSGPLAETCLATQTVLWVQRNPYSQNNSLICVRIPWPPLMLYTVYVHIRALRGGSSGGTRGVQAPPTAAATMEPLIESLLIFKDMKEMEEEL